MDRTFEKKLQGRLKFNLGSKSNHALINHNIKKKNFNVGNVHGMLTGVNFLYMYLFIGYEYH